MTGAQNATALDGEFRLASRSIGGRLRQTELSVPGIHCGGCIQRIEKAVGALDGVDHVRVNLSTKRVVVRWREEEAPPALVATLKGLGFDAHLLDMGIDGSDPVASELLRALAVSGFAAGNIMLLSVSVWLGAEPATRDVFHWISALIAFPALAYSGRIFFRSAWSALRRGQTNMDVPISIGVSVAFAMSLYDTIHHGAHAYFDASITLLFFLLIGRTLDHQMRERARLAVKGLASFAARGAMVRRPDDTREYVPLGQIEPDMTIMLAAGERVPVDGRVAEGFSDLDNSLATGESLPLAVGPGAMLRAGTLNLTGPLILTATATAKDSFLAEMVRLMEAAEAGRGAFRRIADRASQLYAPVVHLAALMSLVGWMVVDGDLHNALTIAVAVLIITCPCALGLAVPMVQVVAARRLFENRVMIRDGSALERLNEIDTAVFDKTGTLTLGQLTLRDKDIVKSAHLELAAALAAHSIHPCSLAICAALPSGDRIPFHFDHVREVPGFGMEAISGSKTFRLGRADWALGGMAVSGTSGTVLSENCALLEVFHFEDLLRPGAKQAIADLKDQGIAVEIISGDAKDAVARLAEELGVANFRAGVLPSDKAARIAELSSAGRRVLMVGDGLNDMPALVAAHVSMAPATAADIGRNAADFVFLQEGLEAVSMALSLSRGAGRLIRQNFALAIAYNAIALPAAIFGYVTPLFAALAMSGSSILVVANALRLGRGRRRAVRRERRS